MVKVDLKLQTGILSVTERFDSLVSYPGVIKPLDVGHGHGAVKKQPIAVNDLLYDFEFGVDVSRALAKKASIVEVAAFKLEQAVSAKETAVLSLIEQILTHANKAKGKSASIDKLQLASTNIDITAGLDNTQARLVGTDAQLSKRSSKRVIGRLNKGLAANDLDLPVLETSILDDAFPRAVKFGARAAAQQLLVMGIDPADVAALSLQIDSVASYAGFGIDTEHAVTRRSSDLLRDRFMSLAHPSKPTQSSVSAYDAGATLPVVALERTPYTRYVGRLKLPPAYTDSRFIVRLTLRDSVGAIVDVMTRQVEHSDNIRSAVTPALPPTVSFGRGRALGNGHLSLTQVDERATSIVVYKKVCNRSSRLDVSKYVKVADIEATVADGNKMVPISVDSTNPIVLRCIAVGPTGELGQSFSSVVINTANDVGVTLRNDLFTNVSVIARIDRQGLAVELRSVPPNVVAVAVKRRDKTLNERTAVRLLEDDGVIMLSENSMVPITFIDRSVKQGHVYEYSCILIDRYGTEYEASNTSTIEYVPFIDDLVDTKIANAILTVIDDNDIDYTFDMVTELATTDLQLVKNLMDTQEILTFFSAEIKDERALLDKLLAHQVTRHNLTTGLSETFGVVVGENFSDKSLRKINGVLPLQRGNTYRYEVCALLRAPETLLNSLVASTKTSGKTYAFKPSKFLHPLALQNGNITDDKSRIRNHARDEMTFGRVGNIVDNELSLSLEAAEIIEFDVEKLGADRVALRWKLAADASQYDHFLIGREALGNVSLVGASHNVPRSGKFEYVHRITRADIGSIRFFVIPVKNDYSLGKETTALPVVIERWH